MRINANEIIKSDNHEMELSPVQNTLILRAINNEDAGLPWVEASLVDTDNLSKSLEIQNAYLEPKHKKYLEKIIAEGKIQWLGVISEDVLNQLKLIFHKKDTLDYFLTNGAWYNSDVKGISDSKGYLILKSNELTPGKKYTLFLWCRSQKEWKPDKEISFIAKDGITDLGAIKFE